MDHYQIDYVTIFLAIVAASVGGDHFYRQAHIRDAESFFAEARANPERLV